MKTFIIIFFCLLCQLTTWAQGQVTISGRLTLQNSPLPFTLVELTNRDGSFITRTLSNEEGLYNFTNVSFSKEDSLYLKVRFLGYKPVTRHIDTSVKNIRADIDLHEPAPLQLGEVVVTGHKSNHDGYRSSYKIKSADFIKNTKADVALQTVPSVSVQDDEIIVDGRNKALVFINGNEASILDLKAIDVSEIERVEVISNPSTSVKSDFIGSVVNVVLKKSDREFIHGLVEASAGARNNFRSIFPSVSLKKGISVFTSNLSLIHNQQEIESAISRSVNAQDVYSQSSERVSEGEQYLMNNRLFLNLTKKSVFSLTSKVSGYRFSSTASGTYDHAGQGSAFSRKSKERQSSWDISSVYNYKLNDSTAIFIKGKYVEYADENIFSMQTAQKDHLEGKVASATKEITGEADLRRDNLPFLGKSVDAYTGVKYIHRLFDTNNSDIRQSVLNAFGDFQVDVSDKLSMMTSLSWDFTQHAGTLSQEYYYFLPTVNAVYHFGKRTDLIGAYSRRIIRPGADNLNSAVYYVNPGMVRVGNLDLEPQVRNYFSLTLRKPIDKVNLSLSVFRSSVNNAIIETYTSENNILYEKLENAAKSNAYGFNLGFYGRLFNTVSVNFNNSFESNTFHSSSPDALVRKSQGYTVRNNLFLNTSLFQKKLGLTLSAYNNSPRNTLISRVMEYPRINLDARTNLFNNKLSVKLSYRDAFALGSNRYEVSDYQEFRQKTTLTNRTTNILLTLTYHFGKPFNDNTDISEIKNEDIIVN